MQRRIVKNLLFVFFPLFFVFQISCPSFIHADVFKHIHVANNKNIDQKLILNLSELKTGKDLSETDLNSAIKKLFDTGLFSDVRLYKSDANLVINVVEYKTLQSITFKGNKKIKKEDLLKHLTLKPFGPFSDPNLKTDLQFIANYYEKIGESIPSISTKIVSLDNGRVDLIIYIKEQKRSKISSVRFVGNSFFSVKKLSEMTLVKKSNFLSFFFKNDLYTKERIQADEESLRRFYMNHGFLDSEVSSSVVFNEEKNSYAIKFLIHEGTRYRFGDIAIENFLSEIKIKNFKHLISTDKNKIYNAQKINDTVMALNEYVAKNGYPYAEVNSRIDKNVDKRSVSISYSIDQGEKFYIERIDIKGNKNTKDYVVRREFDLSEGDLFSPYLIRRTKRRLERLGYFQKVDIVTQMGSASDRVVLFVDLKEADTGYTGVGVGYSTSSLIATPTLEGSFSESNFLGLGQAIKFSAGLKRGGKEYAASFVEPYFFGYNVSAGVNLAYQTVYYDNFDLTRMYGTVYLGFPITDFLTTQLSYNLSSEVYHLSSTCENDSSCKVSELILETIEAKDWVTSSIRNDIIYSTIDNMRKPHSGVYAKISSEFAGIGGDANYIKFLQKGAYYHTILEDYDIVAHVALDAGQIVPFQENSLRFFDQFQNDVQMIRGFERNGIGPYDIVGKSHLGGTKFMSGTAEIEFPVPYMSDTLRLAGFFDVATLYDSRIYLKNKNKSVVITGNDMIFRAATGLGLIWDSPFGLVRIDYGIPVQKEENDVVQELNFGLATRF